MAARQLLLFGRQSSLVWGCLVAAGLLLFCSASFGEQELSFFDDDVFAESPTEPEAEASDWGDAAEVGEVGGAGEYYDAQDAAFDSWQSVFDTPSEAPWDGSELRPFDWVRYLGFRHSSSHGRHVGRGLPLEGTSWRNRPYHVDWFLGSLLGDELIRNRVSQDNELITGLRLGWDFDYFWGLEWRLGWSDPNLQLAGSPTTPSNGSIFLSDIDIVYYPWGDSKIRPFALAGMGFARYEFVDDLAIRHGATLVTLPIGVGVQFSHWRWLVWRFEALDNISFGADGLSTQHSVSLTAGMELRLGARPHSYWPWQSNRRIW